MYGFDVEFCWKIYYGEIFVIECFDCCGFFGFVFGDVVGEVEMLFDVVFEVY